MKIRKMFDIQLGVYCGVFMTKDAMKKVSKLLYKQNQELKLLLTELKEELLPTDWTLAYPNGEQESIYYYDDKKTFQTVDDRIDLINKLNTIKPVDVYIGSQDDAVKEHMRLYDDNTDVL